MLQMMTMFKRSLLVCIIFFLLCAPPVISAAQSVPDARDTIGIPVVELKTPKDKIGIFPLALFGVATIYRHNTILVSKYEVQDYIRKQAPNFNNHADNILQYVPAALPYALDLVKIKSRHPIGKRTLLSAESIVLSTLASSSLKRVFDDIRPNGNGYESFPSGHTTLAFTGAAVLAKEYGKKYPWIKWSGYGIATVVGVFRMLNNKHWLSDVMGGAAVGMFSADAVYFLNHIQMIKKKKKDAVNPLDN